MYYLGPLCEKHAAPYKQLFGAVECDDETVACFRCVKRQKRIKEARASISLLTFQEKTDLLNSLGYVWNGQINGPSEEEEWFCLGRGSES